MAGPGRGTASDPAAGARRRGFPQRRTTNCVPASPKSDLQLQLDVEPFLDATADEVNQAEHVACRGPRVGDDEVVVALADLRAADARAAQAGLLDERVGPQAARVPEHPAGGLKA